MLPRAALCAPAVQPLSATVLQAMGFSPCILQKLMLLCIGCRCKAASHVLDLGSSCCSYSPPPKGFLFLFFFPIDSYCSAGTSVVVVAHFNKQMAVTQPAEAPRVPFSPSLQERSS